MTNEDDQPTPEELAEAAALARALEAHPSSGDGGQAPAPAALLETAALLRQAAPARQAAAAGEQQRHLDAALARSLPVDLARNPQTGSEPPRDELRPAKPAFARRDPTRNPQTGSEPRARRRWVWLAPATLLPATAAVMLFFTLRTAQSPAPRMAAYSSATRSPAPSMALLRAQAEATRGGPALAELDRQMRDYRAAFYRSLVDRSGGGR